MVPGLDERHRVVTSMDRTACSPSNVASRIRISPIERSTSRRHALSFARTRRTVSRNSTVVTRSIAGPTVTRHAKATFSRVSGALRKTASKAPGMAC